MPKPQPGFLPLPLAWSHFTPRTNTIRVPVSLFRHCDVGRFVPVGSGETRFIFDTIVQPNPVSGGWPPNMLPPGDYVFELLLSGDNTNTIRKRWILSFGPDWSDDEATMLDRIELREL